MTPIKPDQITPPETKKPLFDEEFYTGIKYDADEHIKKNIIYSEDTIQNSNNYATLMTML